MDRVAPRKRKLPRLNDLHGRGVTSPPVSIVVGGDNERQRVASGALDAGPVGGAALGGGKAAAARANDAGGHRPPSRRQPRQRLPLGRRPAGAGPARAAGPTADRATIAPRLPRLGTAWPAPGKRCSGSGLWN